MALTLEQIKQQKPKPDAGGTFTLEQIKSGQAKTISATPPENGEQRDGVLKSIGKAIISSETGFGESIAGALPSFVRGENVAEKGQVDLQAQQQKIIDQIHKNRAEGKDNTRLFDALKKSYANTPTSEELNPAIQKTPGQILGEAGGTALDIATVGVGGAALKSFRLARTAKAVSEAAKPTLESAIVKNIFANPPTVAKQLSTIGKEYLANTAKIAPIGYGYDVTSKLQEGTTGGEAFKPGIATAISPLIPLPTALKKTGGVVNKALAPTVVNSLIKPLLKDFSYGKNPGRAVAQEGIIGNSLDDLAKNIGTRRQDIGEKIQRINSRLDKGGTKVDLTGVLKPIDDAMEVAAKANNQPLLDRLQKTRDSLNYELKLGKSEEGLPIIEKSKPRQFFNTQFSKAFELKKNVGDVTRWTGNASDDKDVNGALKKVYGAIKEKILVAAEKTDSKTAEELGILNEKYADLTSAEIAAKYRDKIFERQNLISLPQTITGGGGAAVAAILSGGAAIPTILAGLGGIALDKALSHPAVKTRIAAWMAKESPSVLEKFVIAHPKVANAINYAFFKERGRIRGKTGTGATKVGEDVVKAESGANVAPGGKQVANTEGSVTRYTERPVKSDVSRETEVSQDLTKGGNGKPKVQDVGGNAAFGAAAGIQTDDNGNVKISPTMAALGVLGVAGLSKVNVNKLTTKTLRRIEEGVKGESVSKQFIEDLTNRPDLKQGERELVRAVLGTFNDAKVNVKDFSNAVRAQLLPIEVTRKVDKYSEGVYAPAKPSTLYENVTLAEDLRGPIANYSEHIYQSPIKTSAGDVHFRSEAVPNYFAHTRVEDLPGKNPKAIARGISPEEFARGIEAPELRFKGEGSGDIRRIIELQSDLFQKGRLEAESSFGKSNRVEDYATPTQMKELHRLEAEMKRTDIGASKKGEVIGEYQELLNKIRPSREAELSKLEPYRNTWHERVIREEIKQAAKDGKTKLQFPTGETAMKIEGLGENSNFFARDAYGDGFSTPLKPERLKVGEEVWQGGQNDPSQTWIITDILGDGKFKAIQKDRLLPNTAGRLSKEQGYGEVNGELYIPSQAETFDISGKIDTNNPIYKFYEKDVQRYLTRNYGGKVITDPQGVKWVQIDVPKGAATSPIEAFGAAAIPVAATASQNK